MMQKQQETRGPGRPRTGRKPRIDATVSQEVSDFLNEWGVGRNVSAYLEDLIKSSPQYHAWLVTRDAAPS